MLSCLREITELLPASLRSMFKSLPSLWAMLSTLRSMLPAMWWTCVLSSTFCTIGGRSTLSSYGSAWSTSLCSCRVCSTNGTLLPTTLLSLSLLNVCSWIVSFIIIFLFVVMCNFLCNKICFLCSLTIKIVKIMLINPLVISNSISTSSNVYWDNAKIFQSIQCYII